MGQQIRKVTKRRRRIEYIKRKKDQAKLGVTTPIRLAVAVNKEAKTSDSAEAKPAKKAPAKKAAAAE